MVRNSSERTLRIIGGKWRGRKVSFNNQNEIRPTPDRIRETLFNWLAPQIRDAHCLDLFTGSGMLAMEALSRGAVQVTLIDRSKEVISQIRGVLMTLGAEKDSYRLTVADAFDWLNAPVSGDFEKFDLIFLDPPFTFKSERIYSLMSQLNLSRRIRTKGLIYVETAESLDAAKLPETWVIRKQKKAGRVHYCLCQAGV